MTGAPHRRQWDLTSGADRLTGTGPAQKLVEIAEIAWGTMSILFAHHFEVVPRPGQTSRQCMGLIRELVAAWVSGSYGRRGANQIRFPFDGTAQVPQTDHEIWTNQQDCSTHQLATVEWSFPNTVPPKGPVGYASLFVRQEPLNGNDVTSVWRFSCQLACNAHAVEVALGITVGVDGGMLKRFRTQLNRTNYLNTFRTELLERLFGDWYCRIGEQPILPFPTPLIEKVDRFLSIQESAVSWDGRYGLGGKPERTSDPVQKFVETVLLCPKRRLPVVMVAEDEELVKAAPDAFEYTSPAAQNKRRDWCDTHFGFTPDNRGTFDDPRPALTERRTGQSTFPETLQNRLLGLAQVAIVDRAGVGRFAELLGRDRTVTVPGLRIYWPGFTHNTPAVECSGYGIAELTKMSCRTAQAPTESLEKYLHRELTQLSGGSFREGPIIRAARAALALETAARVSGIATLTTRLNQLEVEADQARQARERFRQERDARQRQLDNVHRDMASLRAELLATRAPPPNQDDELVTELERSWAENARLKAEIDAERRRVADLEALLRAAQENQALVWQPPAEAPVALPPDERSFASVGTALAAAAVDFVDTLTVWEDAVRAAEGSLFASPDQVYRALRAIAEVGRDYFSARSSGTGVGPLDQAFQKRIPYKYTGFESAGTLSLYGADRVFRHGRLSLQMQRHLTLGRGGQTNNCLQIYFEFDHESERVLIGYCGRHLPYAGQRT